MCVVHAIKPGHFHDTAIDKRPRSGPTSVDEVGLDGDEHVDGSHGGRDGAVYVYADEDAEYFARQLGRPLAPGSFGENVRTSGLDVSGARLGERWRIGEVVLEVCKPRTPCANLSQHVGVSDFHRDFHRSGRVGALCRVLHPGALTPGDTVLIETSPHHRVTVADFSAGIDADGARELLASGVSLAKEVRAKARRIAARDRPVSSTG